MNINDIINAMFSDKIKSTYLHDNDNSKINIDSFYTKKTDHEIYFVIPIS